MSHRNIKHITPPIDLKSAHKLTPLEMNKIRYQRQHSVLSPDKLGLTGTQQE